MDINYTDLTLEQLKEINKRSAAAIADFESRQKKAALAKATEIAKAAGFSSLQDMLAAQPAKTRQSEPKYRHPDNAELTWSGLGRKPKWIAEALEAGKPLEEFAIQKPGDVTQPDHDIAAEKAASSDQAGTAPSRQKRKSTKAAEQEADDTPAVKPARVSKAAAKVSTNPSKVTKARKPKADLQAE